MRPYPTREGLPVHPDELGLRPSRLNPDKPGSYNNHHMYFNKGKYLSNFVLNTLRNLERNQIMMLQDQHNMGRLALHSIYSQPKAPTMKQAMEVIDEAHSLGENLKIKTDSKYVTRRFSDSDYKQVQEAYNNLRR